MPASNRAHLLLDGVEAEVELDEVGEDCVEVGVQLEQHDLPEVRVVDVGEHVKEEAVDLADVRVERRWELLALHQKFHIIFDCSRRQRNVQHCAICRASHVLVDWVLLTWIWNVPPSCLGSR